MIRELRNAYNSEFTLEKYNHFFKSLYERFPYTIEFKVAETPVFIPKSLKADLLKAGEEIIDTLCREDFKKITHRAVPDKYNVPGEDDKTLFLALDFGICKNDLGEILPQLIEMQGFSSLHGYQHELGIKYRKYFSIPESVNHLFNGLNEIEYIDFLRRNIVANHNPENVIILEIEPEKQKTWVDFWILKEMLGIEPVCISKISKEGKKLFYFKDGIKTPIYRIYNRLIFDEFELRKDLDCAWNLTEEADVEWAGHPNWFFRISKYTLPFIKSKYVPETYFLHELKQIPTDLENWVLKPLFSFAGGGVIFDVTPQDIDHVENKQDFILQKKVQYEAVIETPDLPAKCEIRLMYIWEKDKQRPELIINLARLSKGKMIGVNFNKNKDWVGGTVAYFE